MFTVIGRSPLIKEKMKEALPYEVAPGKMKVDTEKVPTFIFCCRIGAKGVRAWERKEHRIGDSAKKRKSES